jgi:hypothetical protein
VRETSTAALRARLGAARRSGGAGGEEGDVHPRALPQRQALRDRPGRRLQSCPAARDTLTLLPPSPLLAGSRRHAVGGGGGGACLAPCCSLPSLSPAACARFLALARARAVAHARRLPSGAARGRARVPTRLLAAGSGAGRQGPWWSCSLVRCRCGSERRGGSAGGRTAIIQMVYAKDPRDEKTFRRKRLNPNVAGRRQHNDKHRDIVGEVSHLHIAFQ